MNSIQIPISIPTPASVATVATKPDVGNVLELCSIPDSLNKEQMKGLISSYMASRIEFYRAEKRAPFVEDEFSEYFTAKCTGGEGIGKGSFAMDVQTKSKEGIDAMCVVMKGSSSNEKSLIQNFKSSGVDLDTLFKEKRDTEAVNLFVAEYSKKLHDVKTKKALTDLYILAFISTSKAVHLVCFKINLENIAHVSSGGFVKGTSTVNILTRNFIDPSYGNVKLYKSKKRMELRLLPDVIKSEHAMLVYTFE